MTKNVLIEGALDSAKKYITTKAKEVGNNLIEDVKNDISDACQESMTKAADKAKSFIGDKLRVRGDTAIDTDTLQKSDRPDIKKNMPIVRDNMSSEEEDSFIDDIPNRILSAALPAIKNPAEALKMINNLVEVAGDVAKFQELQETKRALIESQRQIALKRIDAQKTLLMDYLNKTFDERRENFKKYFEVVDHALKTNNIQELTLGLESVNRLALSSPFKDLSSIEMIRASLDDPNKEWDF